MVTACQQSAGRDRMGRGWLDRPGKSLLVSLVLKEMEGFRAAALAALSARAAVRRFGGSGPLFKWPNDLVYGDRKVGGILSELVDAESGRFIIVGLGINVAYLPGELVIKASHQPVDRGRPDFPRRGTPGGLPRGDERKDEGRRHGLDGGVPTHLAYREEEVVAEYALRGTGAAGARRAVGSGSSQDALRGILAGADDGGYLLLRVEKERLAVASGDLAPLSRPGGRRDSLPAAGTSAGSWVGGRGSAFHDQN